MNNNLLDLQLSQSWQFAAPFVGVAWEMVQRMYADAPTSLLTGVVIGLILSRLLRGALVVVFIASMAFIATRMLGISIPGIG